MDIWYPCSMQKPFVTQAELFVSSSDLEHPTLHALDATEAVLDWSKLEPILSSIYASKTGRPSYPLLTLFRGLLLGVLDFVPVPGQWGTLPLSMKGAPNGTTSKNIYRRV